MTGQALLAPAGWPGIWAEPAMQLPGAVVFWAGLGFLLGSLPFAVWVARFAGRFDVRDHGDGNPGAFNAWQRGGWRIGLPVLLLDFLKGALPVALARHWYGMDGWGLALVAIAPILGHAFSPFLRGRGGKGITVTFGVWTGLAMPWAPLVLGITLVLCVLVHVPNSWSALLAMLALLVYIVTQQMGLPALAVWAGNAGVLAWKFRRQLMLSLGFRAFRPGKERP
jgi:acyl phosphate:glycerol-3-phosphate acyltransferase